MTTLREIGVLLRLLVPEPRQRLHLAALGALSVVLAFLEAAGVGSIAPLVALLQAPDRFGATSIGSALARLTGSGEPQRLLFVLSALIIGLFLIKTVVALLNGFLVQRYSQSFFANLSSRLLDGYMRMPFENVAVNIWVP